MRKVANLAHAQDVATLGSSHTSPSTSRNACHLRSPRALVRSTHPGNEGKNANHIRGYGKRGSEKEERGGGKGVLSECDEMEKDENQK